MWFVDVVSYGVVVLIGCKAERFIFEKNGNKNRGGKKMKCLGVLVKFLNGNIVKKIKIEVKVMVFAVGFFFIFLLMIFSGLRN